MLDAWWLVAMMVGTNLHHFKGDLGHLSCKQIVEHYIVCVEVIFRHDIVDIHLSSIVCLNVLVGFVIQGPILVVIDWAACKQFEDPVFDDFRYEWPHDLGVELVLTNGLHFPKEVTGKMKTLECLRV